MVQASREPEKNELVARKREPTALLHQSAATSEKGDAWYEPPLGDGLPRNAPLEGHMLTNHELKTIESIPCLEAKQRDPAVNCSNFAPVLSSMKNNLVRPLNAGNYPTWKDPMCFGEGEYFCDPDLMLEPEQRKELTAQMAKVRREQLITCGPQLQHDPIDKWHYDPFYLGVAIAKDWPLHESDAQSLQSFGRILAARWNMTFPWDGSPSFYARCPNEAMLIILPEKRQAYLSSPSCMFVCEEKGGPEITTATLLRMDSHGLAAGVSAGISQVYKVLNATSPMHKRGWQPTEKTAGTWRAWNEEGRAAVREVAVTGPTWEEWVWNSSQRFVFGIAVLLLAGSITVSVLVCYLAPGLAKDLNKSTKMSLGYSMSP